MTTKDLKIKLFSSSQTVFNTKDVALLLEETRRDALKSQLNYYVKKGVLRAVRRGIYVKPSYNPLELATKIYTPSYISLETVLEKEGIVFQHYETIFVISYLSREIEVDGHNIRFRRIKEEVLFNKKGIEQRENYFIAQKERAFLDVLYLYKNYHFDNLEALNRQKAKTLVNIYQNKALKKRVKAYLSND